jgi:hypothetical protein
MRRDRDAPEAIYGMQRQLTRDQQRQDSIRDHMRALTHTLSPPRAIGMIWSP